MPSPDYRPKPGGKCHPVDYQLAHHVASWNAIKANPHIWGAFVWVIFDTGSDSRREGARDGINDYLFYQKEWQTTEEKKGAER